MCLLEMVKQPRPRPSTCGVLPGNLCAHPVVLADVVDPILSQSGQTYATPELKLAKSPLVLFPSFDFLRKCFGAGKNENSQRICRASGKEVRAGNACRRASRR